MPGAAKFFKAAVAMTMAALLAACVTTKSGGYTDKADENKALTYSIELARQYIAQENWEAAKRHLKYALSVDENHAPTHETLASLFEQTGEIELAEEHYKKALDIDPDFTRARNNYAVFLYQQQRYKEAAKQLEKVVENVLYDNRFGAFLNLGSSYMKLGKYEDAARAFNRAYLLNRKAPPALLGLAEAELRLENYVSSQKHYDQYREQVETQSASGLWLGIRLADHFGNHDAYASYALALQSLYPKSEEYLSFREYEASREASDKAER